VLDNGRKGYHRHSDDRLTDWHRFTRIFLFFIRVDPWESV